MGKIETGNSLGDALLKAMGIDSKMVLEMSLCIKPGELATVTIVRAIIESEAAEMLKALEQYTVERKPEDPKAQALETVSRNLTKARATGWP
jgi:hypothetical protein